MAVPKKRTSKSKKNSRKAVWKAKAKLASQRAFSFAKSYLTSSPKSFIYVNLKKQKRAERKAKEKEDAQ